MRLTGEVPRLTPSAAELVTEGLRGSSEAPSSQGYGAARPGHDVSWPPTVTVLLNSSPRLQGPEPRPGHRTGVTAPLQGNKREGSLA